MKTAPAVDTEAQLRALAELTGADFTQLYELFGRRRAFSSPGVLVDDEKPLGVGTVVNMRRSFPSGKHRDDLGWYVAGYMRKRDGRWTGYLFVQLSPYLQSRTGANCESYDVIEPREVLSQ